MLYERTYSFRLSYMSYIVYEEDEDTDEEETKSSSDSLVERSLKTRTILLSGEINKDLAERIIRQLLILEEESSDPVRVFIDSPGGDVDAGYAIFDMIRFVSPPVYTIGMGLVASAGVMILLAASKAHRIGLPNSHYLIHQPLIPHPIHGVATDISIHAKEMEKTRSRLDALISTETGKTRKQVAKDTDRDHWMLANEAKEYGLISRVITNREELDSLPGNN